MQNDRTSLLMSTFRPELAIIVNRAGNKITGEGDYYLESHTISPEGKILEGKPLLQETIQEMVDVFFDERKNTISIKGLIPENLLAFELLPGKHYKMIWYKPAEIRVMHFAKQLGIPTGKTWVPPTLYVVNRKAFKVYSLKNNSRPTEKTKIFRAPYHNVNDLGEVCLGNATVRKPVEKTFAAYMKYWEDLFWLSEFTHMNGGRAVKTNLDKVWKSLLVSKTKKKWSDIDELIELKNVTLKKIL